MKCTRRNNLVILPGIVAGILVAWFVSLAGCSKGGESDRSDDQTVPVSVAKVEVKTVPVELRSFGTVEAYATVNIKAQIGGVITKVHFTEGQDVKKGDPLFTIDPRPAEAELNRAKANLDRDTAQLHKANRDSKRYVALLARGAATQDELDTSQTNEEALTAAIEADKAAIEEARLQLAYCSVLSPIDGRTGSVLIDEGNVVKANDLSLVSVMQIRPINVIFSLPQQNLAQIRQRMSEASLPVTVFQPGDNRPLAHGMLVFLDNTVDTATGTVLLRAKFDNLDGRLWPGLFVVAVLELATQPGAIIVPTEAIQTGQQGQFIWVLKPDNTVTAQVVTVGRKINGETVIEGGLEPDATVITDGQLRLVEGSRVISRPSVNVRPAEYDAASQPATAVSQSAATISAQDEKGQK